MARLARGEFGRLLFGAQLGRGELRLERLDMGFERSDDLIGEPPFVDDAGAQRAIVRTRTISFQPSGGRIRVRLSFPSVFCHRPRLARCRTASVDTLNSSAACL